MATPWFDPNLFGAIYGSVAGGVGGTLGGLLGAAAGVLAPQGKGRAWVMAGFGLLVAAGLASLGFGVAALAMGQPYGIWYPPVLVGLILPGVVMGVLPAVRKRYAEAESRRIDAEGLRQG
jgi:hypothetical protein